MTDTQHAPADVDPAPPAPPRRHVSWTSALAVSLAAFFVWLLIDAPTLQHNAQVSPVGARRTVSLDLVGPLAALSRGVGLSHVVGGFDRLIGRHGNLPGSGSSVVVTVRPRPTAAALGKKPVVGHPSVPGGSTPVVPTGLRPTPAAPLRALIVGDSLGLDLGTALRNDLANTGVVSATLDGRESTGLTRPDYYNWPAELQADLARYRPQLVVIMMGANDPQDFVGPPDVPYGGAAWDAMYTQRVDQFMTLATSTGASVVWVGLPPMLDPGRSAAAAHLDAIYQAEAAQVPGTTFLSSWTLLGTPQGQYTPFLLENGQEVNVRAPDGIHISPGGGELLSQAVLGELRSRLHIALPAS